MTAGKVFGPRQTVEAARLSRHIWAWSMDLLEAGDDADRVAKLCAAISEATDALAALAGRASS